MNVQWTSGTYAWRPRIARAAAAALAALALASSASSALGAGVSQPRFHGALFGPKAARVPFSGSQRAVCSSTGGARCLIHVLNPGTAAPLAGSVTTVVNPTGLSPNTIEGVYGYSKSDEAGAGETIALVDAYNDPNAAGDLAKFSTQYGLPAAKFRQVSQTGGSTLPATESGWDLEISLDIEWAHAIAPGASILLVEAKTASLANLLAAETYASAHANYVSNSWGSSEFSSESAYESYFAAAGVSYFAAAGDEAGEVDWPSASPAVTSVGGSTLTLTAGGTIAGESAWDGGGGGCSLYEIANPSQTTGGVNCHEKRATPDVALDANPNSGVSVYDSVTYDRQSGWWTVGGTSAATVMWAAESAVAANPITATWLYSTVEHIPFRDITQGTNGYPALVGYDLVTGLGSWSYTPGAPSRLTATREGAGVKLAWSPPTGARATEYAIWRGTAPEEETTLLATVPAADLAYTDSKPPEGPAYYEIQALNGAGSGPFSVQALAVPPSTPPSAAFSTSCSGATCSFDSTSTDEHGTIDAYAWSGGNGVTGASATFSDRYTAAGKYTVTLQVENTAGQSSGKAEGVVTCTTSSGRRGRSTLTCT